MFWCNGLGNMNRFENRSIHTLYSIFEKNKEKFIFRYEALRGNQTGLEEYKFTGRQKIHPVNNKFPPISRWHLKSAGFPAEPLICYFSFCPAESERSPF